MGFYWSSGRKICGNWQFGKSELPNIENKLCFLSFFSVSKKCIIYHISIICYCTYVCHLLWMIFNHLQKSDKIVDIIFQSSKQRDFPIIKFLHNYPFGLLIFEIINYNFPFFSHFSTQFFPSHRENYLEYFDFRQNQSFSWVLAGLKLHFSSSAEVPQLKGYRLFQSVILLLCKDFIQSLRKS